MTYEEIMAAKYANTAFAILYTKKPASNMTPAQLAKKAQIKANNDKQNAKRKANNIKADTKQKANWTI